METMLYITYIKYMHVMIIPVMFVPRKEKKSRQVIRTVQFCSAGDLNATLFSRHVHLKY